MTTPVGTIPSPTPIGQVPGTPPAAASTAPGSTAMDKDMFLKLLVAQMRYQDPSNPADSTAFVAQSAQFTQVEKLDALVTGQQQLLGAQLMLGASALIGRTVVYTGVDGKDATGPVSSVSFAGSNPTVRVGDKDVPLSSVTEVRSTAGQTG
jgi:flagellar basal-body rod modification protein FlgD